MKLYNKVYLQFPLIIFSSNLKQTHTKLPKLRLTELGADKQEDHRH